MREGVFVTGTHLGGDDVPRELHVALLLQELGTLLGAQVGRLVVAGVDAREAALVDALHGVVRHAVHQVPRALLLARLEPLLLFCLALLLVPLPVRALLAQLDKVRATLRSLDLEVQLQVGVRTVLGRGVPAGALGELEVHAVLDGRLALACGRVVAGRVGEWVIRWGRQTSGRVGEWVIRMSGRVGE